MTPSISVVVPTFNRRVLLRQTLDCLLAQSLPPTEIIVVDDFSTDGTMAMLAEDYRGTCVRPTTKNRDKHLPGPGGSRNQGFELSKGDYIKYLDSDDLLTKTALENQLKALQDSGADACYMPYAPALEESPGQWKQTDAVLQHRAFGRDHQLPLLMAKGFFFNTGSLLTKRGKIEVTDGWPEEYPAYEDYCFLFRLSLAGTRFVHLASDALIYRMHPDSLTGGNMDNSNNDAHKVKALADMIALATKKGRHAYLPYFKYQLWQLGAFRATAVEKVYFLYLSYKLRLEKKLGRLRTKTNWQPEHGPNAAPALFDSYIKNL